MAARTFDDLVPITHDLVVVAPRPDQVAARTGSTSYRVDTTTGAADADHMVAIFGGVTRKGRWRIRRRTQALAVFGGIDLDLREAVFDGEEVEISGIWCFGGLDIKVPAGMEVRDQTVGIFGGTDIRDLGEHQSGAPTLVIKGLALFGGVAVKGPKPERKRP
jgi:hypothetical protein